MNLVINFLLFALQIYSFILLGRVLLSWFPNVDRSNPLIQMLYDLTEPVLRPIRDMLPATSGMDFSPMVVFLGIYVLSTVIRTMF